MIIITLCCSKWQLAEIIGDCVLPTRPIRCGVVIFFQADGTASKTTQPITKTEEPAKGIVVGYDSERPVEVDVSDLKNNPAASSADSPGAVSSVISDQLRIIESRCNDAENRLRRCNLLFFGLSDDISETWPSAETKVIDLCKKELDITVDSSQIERAHRIGKYDPEKCRPVMVKFTLFKDKQQIIGNGIKLKGTNYAVREDFSFQTRLARRKLIEFAKPQKVPYKLNVDKLRINDSVYVYDAATDTVKLSSA
ncbi:uncharacterized protein LOC144112581 [Amblyomma americanum]